MESKCTLTNEELAAKVTAWAVDLAKTGGTAWCLSIPVSFTKDPDVLIIECADRLKAADEQLAAKDKEIERLKQALREIYTITDTCESTSVSNKCWIISQDALNT